MGEIESNTNIVNVLWHTGVMKYPCPVANLVDPWTGRNVVLGISDFELTPQGVPALGPSAYKKALESGIPRENLEAILGIILCPEDYREPGEEESGSNDILTDLFKNQ